MDTLNYKLWMNCFRSQWIVTTWSIVCREFNKSYVVGNKNAPQIIKEKEQIKIDTIEGVIRM